MTEPPPSPSPPQQNPWQSPIEQAPAGPPEKTGLRRTWVIVLLSVLAALCLLSITCFVSCGMLFKKGKKESAQQVVSSLKGAAAAHPRRTEYEPDLDRLEHLVKSDKLKLEAFARLTTSVQAARSDNNVDAQELDTLMVIVRDINQNKGGLSKDRR